MVEKPRSGSLFGIPYNFEPPKLRRLVSSYWQPGEGMLVEKPFGVGYTLNLASWRSWVALGIVGALLWNERKGKDAEAEAYEESEEPVEVIVDD
jgi:hypothetical protein